MVTSRFSSEYETPVATYNTAFATQTLKSQRLSSTSSRASKSQFRNGDELSPMALLHRKVTSFFCTHPETIPNTTLASARLNAIKSTISNNHWTATKLDNDHLRCRHLRAGGSYVVPRDDTCWTLCSAAARLVMVLAAPQASANAAFTFPGHDTRAEIAAGKPSANLRQEVELMQKMAETEGRTMGLTVGLVDCCDRAKRFDAAYTTYNHWFVIVVGPEGLRLYQSWFEQYSLAEWLESGGARVRGRGEVKELLQCFDVLQMPQNDWSDTINSAYHTCFDVDISSLRRKSRRSKRDSTTPPISPYCPYFSVSRLDDIKALDIDKFRWECSIEVDDYDSQSRLASCGMGAVKNGPYRRSSGRDSPARSPRNSVEVRSRPASMKGTVWPGPLERFMW